MLDRNLMHNIISTDNVISRQDIKKLELTENAGVLKRVEHVGGR